MTITTPEDLLIMQERIKLNMRKMRPIPPGFFDDEPDEGPESVLASKIVKHAISQGWPHLYFPQSRRVRFFLPPGWPDFVIAIPEGRTIYLETKTATGELRIKQRLMFNMLTCLGHEVHKCKSFKRYLQIVGRKEK